MPPFCATGRGACTSKSFKEALAAAMLRQTTVAAPVPLAPEVFKV